MEVEVAVIDGGPSGLITAREAANRGAHVLVLEEHDEIGLPVECAGLLSLGGLRAIGLKPDGRFVLNLLRRATFYSPSGIALVVEAPDPVACVVDRHELDARLAELAEGRGADIALGRLVKKISIGRDRVELRGDWGSLKAELAVVAEGFRSRLVRQVGLRTIDWRRVLPASQVEVPARDLDEEGVEVHLGSHIAPGFFAWVIPLGDGRARVGLACRGVDPRRTLRIFLRRRLGLRGIEPPYSGSVLTCGPVPKTYSERVLVVGDAAGQVKPTTGGGVILGGLCAKIAGKVAAEALREGDASAAFLRKYEQGWRELLGREFSLMLKLRKLLDALPDKAMDMAFRMASELDIAGEISARADMDLQSSVISGLPILLLKGLLRAFGRSTKRPLSP